MVPDVHIATNPEDRRRFREVCSWLQEHRHKWILKERSERSERNDRKKKEMNER
jgi:hypothetical protein